jgi:hypothetical protein
MSRCTALGGALALAACGSPATTVVTAPTALGTAPTPDPRVGLRAGKGDAGQAIWNMGLRSNTAAPGPFADATNSDLAFSGNYAIQGNYNGFMIWDISNPGKPSLLTSQFCPASQSDVSIYKNLLFVSAEGLSGRVDCGAQGVADSVSKERMRGIRIFDVSDMSKPRYVTSVQTCRGSHTHTVVSDPRDKENIYIYVSGSAGVRSPSELPGCSELLPDQDANSALFRIEVIQVPLANPQGARVVSSPRIFTGLTAPTRHADPVDSAMMARQAAAANNPNRPRRPTLPRNAGPTQCHDITVYPSVGLAGGACGGYGLLLDISDVKNPVRIDAAADSNFAFWHSATFSNDGSKILFTDEWGGGNAPRCRATDKYEWGANAIFSIENRKLKFHSYYKMPAPQTNLENCVAHNGSLIPIPGREVMVQGWYQGGISVFDWTNPDKPFEVAYHDRGPLDGTRMQSAGSWSVYWYNGVIVSSEIARGLDVLELKPSAFISQNEIDAAKTVKYEFLNAQEQPKMIWPPSFSLARAYLDQLERDKGLAQDRVGAARTELAAAERQSGAARRESLQKLAARLRTESGSAANAGKVRTLAQAIQELAGPAM